MLNDPNIFERRIPWPMLEEDVMTAATAVLQPWQRQALLTALVVGSAIFVRWLTIRSLRTHVDDAGQRYRLRAITTYVLIALVALALGAIWLEGIEGGQFATYFGFVTAGLAIALRDPLVNLVAWLYITTMRPFRIGDRIEIATVRGDVVGQDPFAFQMLELGEKGKSDQSTGRVASVPNSTVFTQSVINSTLEFAYLWHEIPVVVTFESDWRRLRTLLITLAERHAGDTAQEAERALRSSSRLLVEYGVLTPCVYTKAVDHGVQVTLRCLVPIRGRRIVSDAIWRDLLEHFEADAALDLAYPTRRVYDRVAEGG